MTAARDVLDQLFRRATVLRWLGRVVASVALLSTLLLCVVSAFTLSPEQMAQRDLGPYSLSFPLGEATTASGVGEQAQRAVASLRQGGATAASSLSVIGIPSPVDGANQTGIEADWSGTALSERYELLSGRWPRTAGEVAVSASWPSGSFTTFGGAVTLVPVATVRDRFDTTSSVLLLGPGTWASWPHDDLAQRVPGLEALATIYVSGVGVDQAASLLADQHVSIDRQSLMLRDAIVGASRGTAAPLALTVVVPAALLPALTALIAAAVARAWLGKRERTLWTVGISQREARRALHRATWRIALIAGAVGIALGFVLAIVVRPVLSLVATQPLSPWWPPRPELVAVAAGTVGGILAGVLARRPPGSALVQNRRWVRSVRRVAVLAACCAFGALVIDPRGTWGLLVLCLTALIVMAGLVPEWWSRLLTRLPVVTPPELLGVRALARHRGSSLAAGVLIVSVGMGVALPTVLASAIASTEAQLPAEVPVGSLEVRSPDGTPVPPRVRSQLEEGLGLADPITVSYTPVLAGGNDIGMAGLAQDARTAARWLGHPLDASTIDCFNAGGILTSRDAVTLTLSDDLSQHSVTRRACPTSVPREWAARFVGIALPSLATALHTPVTAPALIYTNLTPDQTRATLTAARDVGIDSGYLATSREPPSVEVPVSMQVGVAGLSAVPLIITSAYANGAARSLRPRLATLRSIGLGRSWTIRVVLVQLVLMLTVGTLLAALGVGAGLLAAGVATSDLVLVVPPMACALPVVALAFSLALGSVVGVLRLRASERQL